MKLDLKRLFVTITVLSLIVSNFYLLYVIDRNVKLIGQLNIMIIQQNNQIIKQTHGKWI